jgi:uncharacterized protein
LYSIETYLILFIAAFTAGFIDSIAGGGGLISLPVLLSVGIPPHMALGTNKFQSSFGSLTATLYYRKKGLVSFRDAKEGIFFTFIGAAAGAWTVQRLHTEFLSTVIPVLLFVVVVYTIVTPSLGSFQTKAKISHRLFYSIAGLCLGFYDGFFGPGVGSFWAIAFVVLIGFDLKKATGYTKAMNFTSNIVSLAVFALGGSIMYRHGIVMAVGQLTGAHLGARLAVNKGIGIIRPFFIAVVLATIGKLIYSQFF